MDRFLDRGIVKLNAYANPWQVDNRATIAYSAIGDTEFRSFGSRDGEKRWFWPDQVNFSAILRRSPQNFALT